MATFPSWEEENSALEDVELEVGHGHFFTKKTFHKPTYCHHCTEIVWGIIGTGYVCEGKQIIISLLEKIFADFTWKLNIFN